MDKKNIYITGFMAAGKTTIGKRLGQMTGREFIDMDTVLEERFGVSIAEIFKQGGEAFFRDSETGLLEELSKRNELVVATGGGAPVRKRNRELMRNSGIIVHLDTDISTGMSRLSPAERESRPLWRNKKLLYELFERRKPVYSKCDMRVSVIDRDVNEITGEILQELDGE